MAGEQIKIMHMASFSRSGETLMLRCLNAHPDIHVVHNLIAPPERKEDFALFRLLQKYEPTTISRKNPLVKAAGITTEQIIIVKNAVWEHAYPFNGFVLARNPFSVTESFKIYNEKPQLFEKHKEQFRRWGKEIDKNILEGLEDKDNFSCLCALYNRKMYALAKTKLPIIHYESFVQNPETTLRFLIEHFGLKWHDIVLNSHTLYEKGQYGHGKLPLWQPIHNKSADKYKGLPQELLSRIYGMTYPTIDALGYTIDRHFNISVESAALASQHEISASTAIEAPDLDTPTAKEDTDNPDFPIVTVKPKTDKEDLALARYFSKNYENHEDYYLPEDITANRKPGLSAFIRVKDEEEWLELAVESILSLADEIVITIQGDQQDNTKEISYKLAEKYPDKVVVYEYPFNSVSNGPNAYLQRRGSVHERAYFYNWSLSKTTREYAMKWDGDMVAMDWANKKLKQLMSKNEQVRFCGLDIVGRSLDSVGERPINGLEPRIFRVQKETYYYTGTSTARFAGRKLQRYDLKKPSYMHMKWAKALYAASTAWAKDWKQSGQYDGLLRRGTPLKPYKGEYPKVMAKLRDLRKSAPLPYNYALLKREQKLKALLRLKTPENYAEITSHTRPLKNRMKLISDMAINYHGYMDHASKALYRSLIKEQGLPSYRFNFHSHQNNAFDNLTEANKKGLKFDTIYFSDAYNFCTNIGVVMTTINILNDKGILIINKLNDHPEGSDSRQQIYNLIEKIIVPTKLVRINKKLSCADFYILEKTNATKVKKANKEKPENTVTQKIIDLFRQ